MKRLTALVTLWATNNRDDSRVRELMALPEVNSIWIQTVSGFLSPERASENHNKFVVLTSEVACNRTG